MAPFLDHSMIGNADVVLMDVAHAIPVAGGTTTCLVCVWINASHQRQ